MMYRLISITMILCTCLFYFACEGPEGPQGPPGPRGEMGEQGPKGEDGEDGEDGKDGNANVYTTGWVQLEPDEWRFATGSGATSYTYPGDVECCYFDNFVTFSGIGIDRDDSDFAEENAAVLAYVGFSRDGVVRSVHQIPNKKTVTGGGESGAVEFRHAYSSGGGARWIDIAVALIDGSWDDDYMRSEYLYDLRFRVVVIPPAIAAKMKPVNFDNYEEVADYFNFKN